MGYRTIVRGAKTIKKKKGKGRKRGKKRKGKERRIFRLDVVQASKSLPGDPPCLESGSHGLSYRLYYLSKNYTLAFLSYIVIVSSCSREI